MISLVVLHRLKPFIDLLIYYIIYIYTYYVGPSPDLVTPPRFDLFILTRWKLGDEM